MKRLRKRRGLTIAALAEAADLSFQFVSMLERGQRSAKLATVDALAAALGVTPSELLREGEKKRAPSAGAGAELERIFQGLSEAQTVALLQVVRQVRGLMPTGSRKRG